MAKRCPSPQARNESNGALNTHNQRSEQASLFSTRVVDVEILDKFGRVLDLFAKLQGTSGIVEMRECGGSLDGVLPAVESAGGALSELLVA